MAAAIYRKIEEKRTLITTSDESLLVFFELMLYSIRRRLVWGESVPAADILNRIAKALDVTTDYLLNGTLQDKSADAISDEELLSQFRKVERLPADKKKLVKEFLDSFIFKAELQKQLAS